MRDVVGLSVGVHVVTLLALAFWLSSAAHRGGPRVPYPPGGPRGRVRGVVADVTGFALAWYPISLLAAYLLEMSAHA